MNEVTNNEKLHRFELHVDGSLAGFMTYGRHNDALVLIHTEIDDAFEGKGLGSYFAKTVLDGLRAEGTKIVPSCPFVASFIERHPDYEDMVA